MDAEYSPVLSNRRTPPSPVARRERPRAAIFMTGIAIGLGAMVFTGLSDNRTQLAQAQTAPVAAPAPMASAVPAMPVTGQEMTTINPQLAPIGMPVAAGSTEADRLRAPSLVVDLGGGGTAPAAAAAMPGNPAPQQTNDLSPEARFAARLSNSGVETVTPTRLADTAHIAPQGTVVSAILETAINSDLPGFVRALVTRDVRGFDGTVVLIPRGTRLIGQYRNALAVGQSRAFVVWTRLLTPQGLSVEIQSPGTDRVGRSGLEGETNSHFFRRFGNSILLSVLNAGLSAAATHGGSDTAIIIGSQQQAANIASLALQKEIDIPVTVTVAQGTPIQIFIARDLDFSGVTRK